MRGKGRYPVLLAISLLAGTLSGAPRSKVEPPASAPAEASGGGAVRHEDRCFLGESRRRAELTTRSGRRIELFDGQLAIDGRLYDRCTGLPGSHPVAIARWGDGFAVAFRDEPLQGWEEGRYRPIAGAPKGPVRALAGDGTTLYIGADRGLFALRGGGPAQPVAAARLGTRTVTALHLDSETRLIVGTDGNGVYAVEDGGRRVERVQRKGVVGCFRPRSAASGPLAPAVAGVTVLPPGPQCLDDITAGTLPSKHITALTTHAGALAVGTFDGGVFLMDGEDRPRSVAGAPRHVNALLSTGDRLFIAAVNGLHVLSGGRVQRVALGAPEPHVNGMVLARDGALWLATNRGLYRWKGGASEVIGVPDGLPSPLVYAVTESRDGVIWAGTARGLARRGPVGTRVFSTASGQLPHDWVTALSPDGEGVLVGTYNAGVVRIGPGGRSEALPGFAHAWVNPHGIAHVRGALAVATEGSGVLTSGRPHDVPLTSQDVTALLEHDGILWIGTRAGLVRQSSAAIAP